MSKKKVKVLHIFGGMNRGGAETFIMNIYRNIDRKQFHFDFAVETDKECAYDEEIKSLGGYIYHLSSGRRDIRNYWRNLNEIIKDNQYDVVHSHVYNFSGVAMTIAKKNNVPVRISHSHSTHDGKSNSVPRILYRRLMKRQILNNATNLLGCSKEAFQSLFGEEFLKGNHNHIIYNGIDLTSFKQASLSQSALREQIGLPTEEPVIGHVGRFAEPKNHQFLVKVFQSLHKNVPNAHLMLVGDGPLRQDIEQLVESMGIQSNVHFFGVRSDIPELMRAMDVFLFPSLYEGLGIVLIEAQAAGLPCLISDTIPSGVDMGMGLLYYQSLNESASAWADTLYNLLNAKKPDRHSCFNAIRRNGYDINSSVEQLERIYGSKYI